VVVVEATPLGIYEAIKEIHSSKNGIYSRNQK
jgi:hypothetical protein